MTDAEREALWHREHDLAVQQRDEALAALNRLREQYDALSELYHEAKAEIASLTACHEQAWRCFHCGEVITDREAAVCHFGRSEVSEAACQIDAAKFREMEENHERHQIEDSDADRRYYGMQAEHSAALRREEERGYERGLADGQTISTEERQAIARIAREQERERCVAILHEEGWLGRSEQRIAHPHREPKP